LETSQGSGFCDQPKGLPLGRIPGSQMGKTWDTGTPQGSTCRLNIDEQGVRVSKKRYPDRATAQHRGVRVPGETGHFLTWPSSCTVWRVANAAAAEVVQHASMIK